MKTICIPFFYFLFFTSNVGFCFPSFPSSRIILLIFFPTFLFSYRRRYSVSSRRLLVLSSDSGLSLIMFLSWVTWWSETVTVGSKFWRGRGKSKGTLLLGTSLRHFTAKYLAEKLRLFEKCSMIGDALANAFSCVVWWEELAFCGMDFLSLKLLKTTRSTSEGLTCEVCLNKLLYLRFQETYNWRVFKSDSHECKIAEREHVDGMG